MTATYTVKQLAERFQTRQHTVLSWIASGALRAVNIGLPGARRPTWRVSADAVIAFESARSNRQPARPQRRRRQPAGIIQFF